MSGTAPLSAPAMPLAPPANDRAKLHEAAQKFEAIMVRQMLAAARASGGGDKLLGSQATDTFTSMRDERFADIAAKSGGFGFGRMIEAQLAKQAGLNPPARSREGTGEGLSPTKQALPQPLPQAGGGK
ncbi:MAG: rod-binding protein [Novosphingobium sp.]